MQTRVKVCGITHPADRDVAVSAGADALGFISGVPVETPREIPLDRVAELAVAVPPFLSTVLVTAPPDVESAIERYEQAGTDVVQVHGDLSPAEIATL